MWDVQALEAGVFKGGGVQAFAAGVLLLAVQALEAGVFKCGMYKHLRLECCCWPYEH